MAFTIVLNANLISVKDMYQTLLYFIKTENALSNSSETKIWVKQGCALIRLECFSMIIHCNS